jgi:hypothetical protein
MSWSTLNWPVASYFEEGSEAATRALDELEPVATENWRTLYRRKADGSHWSLDAWDKYQQQFLVRVVSLDKWSTEDHSVAEKALLIEARGGESSEACHWTSCTRNSLQGVAYCVDHLYAQGVRK